MSGLSLAAILLILLACTGGLARAAENPPELDADAWAVIDARTGEVLAEENADSHLPMASTTKMMTAYLALKNLPLDREYPAADYKGDPSESLMGLEPGQMVSARDLLYGLIMLSGNDAAVTLADAVSGSEKEFVALMNRTATRLGLDDTSYENPIGLDGKKHYTSADDLARLGQILMDMPRFRPIASARTAKLRSYSPPLEITTLNTFLLNNEWAKGIKTGHTMKADYVLASDGRRKATELIGAVIGAPTEAARDAETVKLLDYGFSLYDKKVPIRPGRPVVEIPVKYQGQDLGLVSRRAVRIGVREGERLVVTPDAPDEIEGPVAKGDPMGSATVTLNGDPIAKVKLLAANSVDEASLFEKAKGNIILVVIVLLLVLSAILGAVAIQRHRHSSRMRKRLRRVTRNSQ
ncbi:MAG TPA: D-alanyl-D-alanine carboxypeptidase family protein [Solirubrobacterales bacterium]|nr:D-alanyl-D-alanine carboxypeptidase family protein [Solirubrobacterales bacterium]